MSCGKAIQQLRKKIGFTQTELGENLNVTSQAVSKWENDLSQPDFETIRRMTELFGITIDEFAELCKETDSEVAATQVKKRNEEKSVKKEMVGVCMVCGKAVYENDIGAEDPLVCKKCHDAAEQKKQEQAESKRVRTASSFKKAMIIPAVIIGILLTIYLPVSIAKGLPAYYVVSGAVFLVLLYPVIPQLVWGYGIVADIFDAICLRTFHMPGIIFEWSMDGLKFLILMKILFCVLSFLLSIIAFVFGICLCAIVAPFTFPSQIIAARKGFFTD